MKLRWLLVAFACFTAATASPALASKKYGKQVRYAGIHPISKGEGGGICHIEGPHVHIYPANKLEYRVYADNNVFVGDPVAYGWDGPKYAYKGNHPIQVNAIVDVGAEPFVHYCYIDGPHFHYFEPEGQPDFKVVGDAYFYVGEPAPAYIEARPAYVAINATYRPLVYTRPVIEVEPPSGWIGARVDLFPVAIEASAPVVVAPRPRPAVVTGGVNVDVHIPVPTISVGVGVGVGGGVIVHDRGRGRGKFKGKKWKRH
ncbi:MAG: hypothetical protein HOV81_42040 [Kofleriaceae bacterium]|nr:hypothetical protein [Kofleriaceae bacterium]